MNKEVINNELMNKGVMNNEIMNKEVMNNELMNKNELWIDGWIKLWNEKKFDD